MFSSILVPVDLSNRSDRLVRTAVRLAAQGKGQITLLHVIQEIEGIPASELRPFYDRLELAARKKLTAFARRFASPAATIQSVILTGSPAVEIVRLATRRRADLVVMGSHRVRPGRPGQRLGTTSHKVAIACACPVLLVK